MVEDGVRLVPLQIQVVLETLQQQLLLKEIMVVMENKVELEEVVVVVDLFLQEAAEQVEWQEVQDQLQISQVLQ